MNSPGDRFLTANTPDSLKREADNSISCWKGFLCAWSLSGVSWAVGKPRSQIAAVSLWAAHGCTYIFHTQESFLMAFITPKLKFGWNCPSQSHLWCHNTLWELKGCHQRQGQGGLCRGGWKQETPKSSRIRWILTMGFLLHGSTHTHVEPG